MTKICYFIRHGYAIHNKLFWDIGERAYSEFRDTNLLYKGYEQCEELRKSWKMLKNIDLVCVSPCVRTLDTALFTFKNHRVHFIAKDFLIEYPTGGTEKCNHRKNISDLEYLYPQIDFSEIENDVFPWNNNKESMVDLKGRIEQMKDWIRKRPERNIAVISHSSFIGMLKDGKIGNENNELKHCFPYPIEIS
jgi:broad specificity phosphatase PhoE